LPVEAVEVAQQTALVKVAAVLVDIVLQPVFQ